MPDGEAGGVAVALIPVDEVTGDVDVVLVVVDVPTSAWSVPASQ